MSPSRVASSAWKRTEHAEILRLARVDGQLGGARELPPRDLALVAAERELGAAQPRVQLRAAAGEPPPRDAGHRGLRRLPVTRVVRVLRDRVREPELARRERVELGVRGAGALERLGGAPDAMQRLAEVGGGGRHVLQVAALDGPVERAPQRRDALVDLAGGRERDAERVQRAGVVEVRGALLVELRLLGERAARDADGAVVARLQHERPRLPGEEAGPLRARPVVGQEREAAVERRDGLVRSQHRPQRAVQHPIHPRGAARVLRLVEQRERAVGERHRPGSSSA